MEENLLVLFSSNSLALLRPFWCNLWSRGSDSYKVKGGNLERQLIIIWNSQAKSCANHKLHPSFLVRIISTKGEFGSIYI